MPDEQYSAELAEMITTAMAIRGVSIKDLSRTLEVTYEHARRLAKGFPPSKPILRLISTALELDLNSLERVAVQASIKRRFGDAQMRIAGKNPELEPIERAWKHLTTDQKQDAIAMIESWAKRSQMRR